ncbi:MAG TPA: M20 family metallopeptidase [Blastocatellia bacterium]|nr:M20 family metallopeptidase [Blastocatellia bacterium]
MKTTIEAATLLSYFEQRQLEVLDFIRWLVEQESMSREAEATRRIAENLGDKLAQTGAAVDFISDPRYGATLRARHEFNSYGESQAPESIITSDRADEGSTDAYSDDKQLLVVGHLDTVWPTGTLAARPFRIEDDRAFGPGIFDMKSGVALAAFAMRAIKELSRETRRPVTLLMTCDEETGSHFSRELIEEEGRRARAALVLEPPIPGGTIKTARKGVGEFELIIRGRPAHAGTDPRAGISAITELAHQIIAVNKLSNYESGTTLNVGVVRGGVLSNVIAAEARASIDMRYQTMEEGARITEAMSRLQPSLDGARIEVRGGINRPPLIRSVEVGKLFERAKQLASEIGFELREGSVGGGSDGNFLAALGVPVLDGLGVDGAGAHAEHEHIIISDIPRRAALLTRLIETL